MAGTISGVMINGRFRMSLFVFLSCCTLSRLWCLSSAVGTVHSYRPPLASIIYRNAAIGG